MLSRVRWTNVAAALAAAAILGLVVAWPLLEPEAPRLPPAPSRVADAAPTASPPLASARPMGAGTPIERVTRTGAERRRTDDRRRHPARPGAKRSRKSSKPRPERRRHRRKRRRTPTPTQAPAPSPSPATATAPTPASAAPAYSAPPSVPEFGFEK